MYKTKDEILAELLSNVNSKYDKRVGHLFYDNLSSVSIELEKLYKNIKNIESKLDVNNLVKEELDKYITQNSDMKRHNETYSEVLVNVSGVGTINIGDLFETKSGVQFKSVESKTISGVELIVVKAVNPGNQGNVIANTITQMPITIPGITSVTNLLESKGGYDEETDLQLLSRFLESQQEEITQGNKFSYKKWSLEVSGVGGSRIFPLENMEGIATDNSVLIVIVNMLKEPADNLLVSEVQEYINPLDKNGHGEGQAPLGAYVYVKSANGMTVNINLTVVLKLGYTLEIVKDNLEKSLNDYLVSIAFKENQISYAKLGMVILNTEGVEDYLNLLTNNQNENIVIDEKSVPVLGVVTIGL